MDDYEVTESNEMKERVDEQEEESDDDGTDVEEEITLFEEEGWEQEVFGDLYWNNSDWENELD